MKSNFSFKFEVELDFVVVAVIGTFFLSFNSFKTILLIATSVWAIDVGVVVVIVILSNDFGMGGRGTK